MRDNDELEEIIEPESAFEWDPAARQDALRDIRNQQLDSVQAIVHSIAEAHFDGAASPSASHSEITQILDDMFSSLRRIGGHNAPLSPTFAVPAATALGIHQMSDIDRLVLLVDRLSLAVGSVTDAKQAGLLANLGTLTQDLVESDHRLARVALGSPPRTPRTLHRPEASFRRRSSIQQQPQQHYSPQSSAHMSGSRGSWSSSGSHVTFSTSSDEAALTGRADVQQKGDAKNHELSSTKAKRHDVFAEAGLLTSVPEQQKVDGSVFDMATVRQPSKTATRAASTPFSIETLYAQQPSASGVAAPLSPRSDQASQAASVGERSDSTALPNWKRFSVQTESAASTSLPSYSYDVPGYDAVSGPSHDNKSATLMSGTPHSEDLPLYDGPAAEAGFSDDNKKPVEAPTLLERRRAKLAAQHSAYAARTPEDLAMVQSSIDRLSTVMPQLDNQRALAPEEQREAQLQEMMGRLSESNAKRLNDQRSDPPRFRVPRPAPLPQTETMRHPALPRKLGETRELPEPAMTDMAKVPVPDPESETPATPTTPVSVHSASTSSRRASLLPGAFGRKLSMASIGNALRRASIYDASKVKSKESAEESGDVAGANDQDTVGRRAFAQRSRSKSDIAGGLTSLFNDSRPRKDSAADASCGHMTTQTGFRAIDFADDTPRGRDASLNPRASQDEEDDSMLDDYSFATFDTTTSNHRMSIVPDSPRSPVSWASSSGSHLSSRRSSQLLSSHPATPTWPKSPLTPVSPAAPKKSSKTMVTFAADTLQPPPSGRSRAASLQSQLRDNGLSRFRPGKCSSPPFPPASSLSCDPVRAFASAAASTAVASAGSDHKNDLVVYTVISTSNTAITGAADPEQEMPSDSSRSQSNAADTSVRSASAITASDQYQLEPLSRKVELEFFAEAQYTLGSIWVLLWSNTQAAWGNDRVELTYQLVDEDVTQQQSRTLHITAADGKDAFDLGIACVRCEGSTNLELSSGSSGRGEKRKQGSEHVRRSRSSEGVRVQLPAAAMFAQSGRITLSLPTTAGGRGAICRFKLALTDAERRAGAEESRAEGMVEFPLSAASLSSREAHGFACAVCSKHPHFRGEKRTVVEAREGVVWRALPSEGWEELVDAWMCHGDQELNRSLTETAVKFSSKIQAGSYTGQSEGGEETEGKKKGATVWVGDTYLLLPQSLLVPSGVVFDKAQDSSAQTVSVL